MWGWTETGCRCAAASSQASTAPWLRSTKATTATAVATTAWRSRQPTTRYRWRRARTKRGRARGRAAGRTRTVGVCMALARGCRLSSAEDRGRCWHSRSRARLRPVVSIEVIGVSCCGLGIYSRCGPGALFATTAVPQGRHVTQESGPPSQHFIVCITAVIPTS